MRIIDAVLQAASPEKPACVAGNQVLTYEALGCFIREHVQSMRCLKRRTNVALWLPNSLDYMQWYMTILHAGHVVTPIAWNTTVSEAVNIIDQFDVGMVITHGETIEALRGEQFQHGFIYLCTDTDAQGFQGGAEHAIPETCAPEDVVLMLGTSGSTQSPKKVMLTESNLITNGRDIIESLHYQPDERFLIVLPLTYAAANESQWIVSILLGATAILYTDVLYPMNLYRAIRELDVTSMTVVPSLLRLLIQSGVHRRIGTPSLRTLCLGGGPSDIRTLKLAADIYRDINIVHMYGLTEATTRISHLTGQDFQRKIGSVGRPIGDIEIKIVDESAAPVPPGIDGDILVKGDNVMKGYYRQEEQTKRTIRDGWLWTGDIGMQDNDGYLYITGRKSNTIIYSGVNIYPEEIEEAIFRSGLAKDVVVYGVPNAWQEEVLTADIIPAAPVKDQSVWISDLKCFMSGILPSHKIPVCFHFVDAIRKTGNGKTKRMMRHLPLPGR